jgi:hypothetical protein
MAGLRISTAGRGTVILAIALLCSACSTNWTPVQSALFNPMQIFPESFDVRGLRGSVFYGKNANLYGLDVGLANEIEERVSGVQLAGAVNRAGELDGLGVGGVNEVQGRVRGAQLAGVVNFAGELSGVQLAGILNSAKSVVGVQIGGIINTTEELVGLQIGVLNFNKSGPLPFFPIFNFSFSSKSGKVD